MKIFTFSPLYTILLLFPISQLIAQPTNTTSPKPGDISTGEFAYVAGALPGALGANQTWDYQNLLDSAAESVTKFINPTATPYYSDFPTAQLAASIDDTLYSYYTLPSGNLMLLGGRSAQERFEYAHPYITNQYPLTFGDTFWDSASLYLSVQGQKDTTLVLDTTEVTGYGTLKLPQKTYNNVLQLRHIDVAIVSFYFPGVGEIKLPASTDTTFSYFVNGIVSPLLFYSTSNGQIQLISYYKADALPLDFTGFTATAGAEGVILNWQTADEINTRDFRIQRSLDGQTYTDVKLLQAKGKTHNNYQYTDSLSNIEANTATTRSNDFQNTTLYYRIEQTDLDGSFSYSPMVNCRLTNTQSLSLSVLLYPNPAHNQIHILGAAGLKWYKIYGSAGRLLLSGQLQSNKAIISVTALPPGIYLFEAGVDGHPSTPSKRIKFIKK